MSFIKNIILVASAVILAYILGGTAIGFVAYLIFFPSEGIGSGFFGTSGLGENIISMTICYIFILPFLFYTFGDKFKVWWVGIFLLPALVFIISVDLQRSWFYILILIVGLLAGIILNKVVERVQNRNS